MFRLGLNGLKAIEMEDSIALSPNEEYGTFAASMRGLVWHGTPYETSRRSILCFSYTMIKIISLWLSL